VTYKNLKFQVWDLGGQTSIRYGNVINVDIVGDGGIPGYLHKNTYLIVGILINSQLLTMNISSFQRDFGKGSI
jgi:hypothetical protein